MADIGLVAGIVERVKAMQKQTRQITPVALGVVLIVFGAMMTVQQPTVLSAIGGHRPQNRDAVYAGTLAFGLLCAFVTTGVLIVYSCSYAKKRFGAGRNVLLIIVSLGVAATVWWYGSLSDELRQLAKSAQEAALNSTPPFDPDVFT